MKSYLLLFICLHLCYRVLLMVVSTCCLSWGKLYYSNSSVARWWYYIVHSPKQFYMYIYSLSEGKVTTKCIKAVDPNSSLPGDPQSVWWDYKLGYCFLPCWKPQKHLPQKSSEIILGSSGSKPFSHRLMVVIIFNTNVSHDLRFHLNTIQASLV